MVYLCDKLSCYKELSYLLFDCSYIHYMKSCIWVFWNTIKEYMKWIHKKVKNSNCIQQQENVTLVTTVNIITSDT